MSADVKEGVLTHREDSPTAASSSKRLFGASGVMTYDVTVQTGMGLTHIDVDAATGDEAADKALAKFPGAKVALVTPAQQKAA